jgi:hypothetical protein
VIKLTRTVVKLTIEFNQAIKLPQTVLITSHYPNARSVQRNIRPRSLCTDRARRASFIQKDRGPIFLCTYRASEINKKFIIGSYRHLYLKQTRNAWFEMHISNVVHIWSKETKKYQCIPSAFPLKTIHNNKFNYNFQIFNSFCCFVLKWTGGSLREIMDRWKCFSANHSPPFHRKWCFPYTNFILTRMF